MSADIWQPRSTQSWDPIGNRVWDADHSLAILMIRYAHLAHLARFARYDLLASLAIFERLRMKLLV
jgi:hypothetical protein